MSTKHQYRINGQQTTKRDYDRARKLLLKQRCRYHVEFPVTHDGTVIHDLIGDVARLVERKPGSTWPKVADIALGVDPADVPRAMAWDREQGLTGVEYQPDGSPKFSGPEAYRRYHEARGLVQRGTSRNRNLGSPLSADQLRAAEEMVREKYGSHERSEK